MILTLVALAALQQAGNPARDRLESPPPRIDGKAVPRGRTLVDSSGAATPIRGIVFSGVDAPAKVARAAEAFIGRPATRQTLAELVGALSRAYEDSPVALYTVAIPDQDFADGVVKVSLTEAGVEEVLIEGKGKYPRLQGLASPLVRKAPLSRSIFERQMMLMRSIPGVKFDFATENADVDDDVTMRLKASRKRVEGAVGVNNRGPDLIGDVIADARLDFNSLAIDGDRLRLFGGSTLNPRRFRQVGASYDAPIGLSGLAASASVAFIRTRAKQFDLEGRARVAQFALTYPIVRSFTRAADVSLALDGVNSSNALFGNVISSDKVRTVRLAGGYSLAEDGNRFQSSLTISKGLDALGARVNPIVSEADFLKVSAALSYERDLGKRIVARATALGQYSGDRLPASELFSIGGLPVGRAFDTSLLSGDRGFGGSGEVAFKPIGAGPFGKSEIYGYADGGKITVEGRAGSPSQQFGLASAGVGARAKWKDNAELGLELGRVIDKPYPGYDQKWRVSVAYRLVM
jgi:hemolysin activation/secretion protein